MIAMPRRGRRPQKRRRRPQKPRLMGGPSRRDEPSYHDFRSPQRPVCLVCPAQNRDITSSGRRWTVAAGRFAAGGQGGLRLGGRGGGRVGGRGGGGGGGGRGGGGRGGAAWGGGGGGGLGFWESGEGGGDQCLGDEDVENPAAEGTEEGSHLARPARHTDHLGDRRQVGQFDPD